MAAIVCSTTRTVYYPAPKNASTTLREVFFETDNGFRFRPFEINGRRIDLFWLYRNQELFKPAATPRGFESIAAVRDPIKRFASFYKWAVLDNNCNFERVVEINEFVSDIETHLQHSPKVRFHLAPQVAFIGNDLRFFDRVFQVERLHELEEYLSTRAGVPVRLPVSNPSASAVTPSTLTDESIRRLRGLYHEDYTLLAQLYGS
jgi:hypothetical protein